MVCLTSARFNMKVDVLRQGLAPVNVDPEDGHWENQFDPDSNETIRVWVPYAPIDNPDTPEDETQIYTVACMVRGIVDGGIRVAGTTERFGSEYENIDYARMWFPANKNITKRDRVTNIRNNKGQIIWLEEELGQTDGLYRATVFEVLGVTPVPDPFGNYIENVALLERAEVQGNA